MFQRASFLAVPITMSAAVGAAYFMQKRAEERDWNQLRPPGRLYQVGPHSPPLHAIVRGQGSPCVLLECSNGGLTQDWSRVVDDLAQFTTVVAYDRAGLGFSSGPECDLKLLKRPRCAKQISTELQQLLVSIPNLDASKGVILVGHGQGAASTVEVARALPALRGIDGDVPCIAGLVLLDPVCGVQQAHKDISQETAAAIDSMQTGSTTHAQLATFGVARIIMNLPNSIRSLSNLYLPKDCPTVQALSSRVTHRSTVADEVQCYANDDEQLHATIQMALENSQCVVSDGKVPVLVIGHGNATMFKDLASIGGDQSTAQNRLERLEHLWQNGQMDLAKSLSGNSVYLRAKKTEHHMPQKHPTLTVEAVRAVLVQAQHNEKDGCDVLEKFKEEHHVERVIGL